MPSMLVLASPRIGRKMQGGGKIKSFVPVIITVAVDSLKGVGVESADKRWTSGLYMFYVVWAMQYDVHVRYQYRTVRYTYRTVRYAISNTLARESRDSRGWESLEQNSRLLQ